MKRLTLLACLFLSSCSIAKADAALDAMSACQDLQNSRIPVACVVSYEGTTAVFAFYFESDSPTIAAAIGRVTALACASGPTVIVLGAGNKAVAASCSPTQELTEFVSLDSGIKS